MIVKKTIKEKILDLSVVFSFMFSTSLFVLMFIYIIYEALAALKFANLLNFIFAYDYSFEWKPNSVPPKYSFIPLLWGTFITSLISATLACIFGFIIAIYIYEYSNVTLKKYFEIFLETVGGIPAVLLGFFAIAVGLDFISDAISLENRYNAFIASIYMSIPLTPFFSLAIHRSFNSIDYSLKEMAYALGATRLQTLFKVIIPEAASSIKSSLYVVFARALGETMIPLMIAGNASSLSLNLFAPTRTVAAAIAAEMGEAPRNSDHFHALFLLAFVLIFLQILFFAIFKFVFKKINDEKKYQ